MQIVQMKNTYAKSIVIICMVLQVHKHGNKRHHSMLGATDVINSLYASQATTAKPHDCQAGPSGEQGPAHLPRRRKSFLALLDREARLSDVFSVLFSSWPILDSCLRSSSPMSCA